MKEDRRLYRNTQTRETKIYQHYWGKRLRGPDINREEEVAQETSSKDNTEES